MPWKIEKRDMQWCVVKESDGTSEGCHDSEGDAKAQLAALYANEKKEADVPPMDRKEFWQKTLEPIPDAPQFTSPPNWLTKEAEQSLFERIWDNVSARLGRKDEPQFIGFKVQGNHFFCVASNDLKDRDGEIFTRKAIDAYVARVDMGVTPLPELQVWHAGKSTAIGSVDWVGRHGHFLMAAGQFYGGEAAQAAKAYYAKHAKNTGISHGFTFPAAKFDGKHYHAFNTFEISLLPRGTEANWYTSLEGVKEMALDDRKVNYLKEVFGEEHATRILADWDKRGKALEELGVEFKDFSQSDSIDDVPANKEAVERADKAFSDLLGEVLETSSVPILAAQEAVKQVKAAREEMAALRREIAETKALVEQRPRASQSAQTVVETSHLSESLQQQLKEQNVEVDTFTGLSVQRTP